LADVIRFVLSCEHGGNEIPAPYATHFASAEARAALASHRGWDPGSVEVAERLARVLDAPLVVQRVSRLLVECNRSIDHPKLWSEFSAGLSDVEKAHVLFRHWQAHRDAVRRAISKVEPGALVVHVSVHTFTPVWDGRPRATDVGLLYDPARVGERRVAMAWQRALAREAPARGLGVHLNRPYRGWTDGLVTALRREIPESRYLGFELEVSQGLVPVPAGLVDAMAGTLLAAASRTADHTTG
jgi:predicted N-formylglutamate amidohydrolase